FFPHSATRRCFHSFPTRRSSDLTGLRLQGLSRVGRRTQHLTNALRQGAPRRAPIPWGKWIIDPPSTTRVRPVMNDDSSESRKTRDRKSTRLNSSHLVISYAVFCL